MEPSPCPLLRVARTRLARVEGGGEITRGDSIALVAGLPAAGAGPGGDAPRVGTR